MSEAIGPEAASELRHELRTPINHIVGYAEMLREDAADGSGDAAQLDRILVAARDGLTRINVALPATGLASQGALATLLAELRTPQGEIEAAAKALLTGERAPQFRTDVERIVQAARRLTAVPTPSTMHAAGKPGTKAPNASARAAPVSAAVSGATGTGATGTGAPDRVTSATAAARAGRILIVDDVEENRTVLARRLTREGYEAHSASSGEEALRLIGAGAFDLVLLDVLMPGMDGFAVLERIKGDEATRSIPVVMISALDDLSSVVRCIEHGAEDYLAKPFDPVLLRARIGASVEKKRFHDREADYLRQVTEVIDAAAAVERGTYSPGALAAITGRDDELGRLARVFDAMAVGVRAREARLEQQLAELRADVNIATSEFHAPGIADAVAAADGSFARGHLLAGRYEILDVIGRGGMGVVYHARDRELGEEIAIKTIRRELLSGDEVLADRFKSEIRLARRISHRNVVRTHDLGEADGTAFVTMEFVRGLTVRELLTTRGR
ncbi:MAG: response regulator, partial [Gemmatimonadota bacterium]|nr:response regulator [Gemmatimonadota bacterium]